MSQEALKFFDLLDTSQNGYITAEDVQRFDETIHRSPIFPQHIHPAIKSVCGPMSGGLCTREHFLPVLLELERRRTVENQALWDFKALDRDGCDVISIKDTLFLFKATHQEKFSMNTWNKFIENRESTKDDICFDEVRMFLCAVPDGPPCQDSIVLTECNKLESQKIEKEFENHKEFLKVQEQDEQIRSLQAREKQDYRDKFRQGARRKLQRWNHLGLEAMLFDDGMDWDDINQNYRNRVSVTEMMQAIDMKYNSLKEKLLYELIRKQTGEVLWSTMTESEHEERLLQVQLRVNEYMRQGTADKILGLDIASHTYPSKLEAVIGYSQDKHALYLEDQKQTASLLQADGRTDEEIYILFANKYAESIQGETTGGHLLVDLHKRYQHEKEYLLSVLKEGSGNQTLTSKEMITTYAHIMLQVYMAALEEAFQYSAITVGLCERPQEFKASNFDYDRDLQEMLALQRLTQRKGKKIKRLSVDWYENENKGLVNLQVDLLNEMAKKHFVEREILIFLLQNKEAQYAKASARNKNKDVRDSCLKEFRGQRENWRKGSSEYRVSKRSVHMKILQEGVGLYFENRREEVKGHNLDDLHLAAVVLADLQQQQCTEIHAMIMEMHNKDSYELQDLIKKEAKSRIEEWLDNVSMVILGSFELTAEEKELIEALEQKYDVLRDKLLVESLMNQFGEAEWNKKTEEEQQRLLMKKRLEERRLRQDGKMDELSRLIGDAGNREKNLLSLMGRNREEYEKKLKERLMNKQKREAQGLDTDDEDEEFELNENKTSGNIMKDIQLRFDDELEAMMKLLRGQHGQYMSEQERQALLLRLRREKRRAEKEDNFDEAALLLGLAERNKMSLEEKLRMDRERQLRLARERLEARKKRQNNGQEMEQEVEEKALPEKGDIVGWKESVMKEVERKHRTEHELLITVVMDEGSEELREAATQMNVNEQQTRLQELKTEADELDIYTKDDIEENRMILDESGAIKTVVRTRILEDKKQEEEVTLDYVVTTLLADLQERQDRESEKIIQRLENMNEEEMSRLRYEEITKRKHHVGHNILAVFTEYEGIGDEDELLKALDKKYDTLRDKLLLESLKKQAGEGEWAKLSEQERQKRLMKLKLEERRLRKEGKLDELQALLGDNLMTETNLKALMGENRAKQEDKLKRRLEARRKRVEQGLDPDEDDDGLSEDEDDESSVPLLDLQKRYDDERDALMARLRGMDNQFLSEKERQAELARLKREQRRAKMEENFESAALVLGLAERHQKAHAERFKNDRARQEMLAKERIAALKKRRQIGQSKAEKEITILNNGDRAAMQDSVMQILEKKHEREQEQMLILLQKEYTEEEITIASTLREEEREERLQELIGKRRGMDTSSEEHRQILEEAALLKLASRKHVLSKEKGSEVSDDEAIVTIMADLQQEQDKESETVLESLPNKELDNLVELQEKHLTEIKQQKVENVAITLTRIDKAKTTGDTEIVEALEGKYDALKDKILAEALMQQVGEAEWANLSEKERQAKLVKLKLQEKRLRQEGKYDEAAALLGDAIKSQQALELLMGDTKKAQEEKMRKRLEMRKQRISEGMSTEEADKLEKKEILEEEEELKKKKPRNILEELDNRLDDEREALLKRMREGDERLANERMRQVELAKLKRQQRMARREDQFEAAALVMGLTAQAEDADKMKEQERKRQLQLAKDRLEKRKKMLKEKVEDKGPVPMPDDADGRVAMEDAVIKEMEIKHGTERDVLIKLLQDKDTKVRKTVKAMTEEQRQKKMLDFKEQRRQWRDDGPEKENEEEQVGIFKKAVPYSMEIELVELQATNPDATDNDAEVVLLADLQQNQDEEAEYLMEDLKTKSLPVLKQLKMLQYEARSNSWNDNVAMTLLEVKAPLEVISELEVVKAVENKYDALRDKLIMDALMKQMGEAEWAKLSEKERQAKVTKMKLQQRILCKQGKYDQALALLGDDIKNQSELALLLGYTRAEHKAIMHKRLERLRQLREEREEASEAVDKEELEQIVLAEEEVEQSRKRRNVLQYLNQHFEDEKEALLALLKKKQDELEDEKERQLALSMLRRDQRLMRDEDNFTSAALIFSLGQLHEKNKEECFLRDREKQKKLARERLRAKRRKRYTGYSKAELEMKLKQEEEQNAKSDARKKMSLKDRLIALHTEVLDEMEKKQVNERDTLMELLKAVNGDNVGTERVKNMSNEEIAAEVDNLREERQVWREEASCELDNVDYFQLSPFGVGDHFANIAERQIRQNRILKEAVLLKVEDTRRHILNTKKGEETNLDETVPEILLADLQQKQLSEVTSVKNILTVNADEELLMSLKEDQRKGRREGWMDNLSNGLLGVKARGTAATITSMTIDIANQEKELKDMDNKLENEKKAALADKKKEGKNVNPKEVIAELERQHDAKKKAMQEQLMRQKELQKQRLEARRRKKDEKDYEAGAALALIQGAEEEKANREKQHSEEKDKQSNLMKERLAARKNARKQAEEQKAMEQKKLQLQTANASPISSAGSGRRMPVSEVSEKRQQEIIESLKEDHRQQQEKMIREKEKQTKQIRQRLADRKNKLDNQASQLLSMGERQKTFVENAKKDELNRQKTIVQDRIQKVRYERTQTMKIKVGSAKKFQQMNEADMDRLAKEMESKFKSESKSIKAGGKAGDDQTDSNPSDERTSEASHQRLGEKERQKLIKERQAERRKKKKSVMAAPNMDELARMLDDK